MNFQAMRDLMDRLTAWRIPGNAAKIYLGGEEVFSYASGYADLENGEKMTAEHLINIYSCSKPATVTAALQLYEKGLFLLDDPLYEFIPEYREMKVKCPDGSLKNAKNPITMRQLFTMTAGFNYRNDLPAFEKARELTGGKMDTVTVARCLAEEPLEFEPGEIWAYSLCHDVLAAVVEIISGQRFQDYMKENIFDPLGVFAVYHNESVQDKMAQQYQFFDDVQVDIVAQQAFGNAHKDGYLANVGKNVSHTFGSEYDSGGAGITTTVADYAKFCAALANRGMGLNGERILAPGTVELLKTNQLTEQQRKGMTWSQLKGYGYGLGVRTLIDKAASGSVGDLGEFGWGGAAGASIYVDTERNLAMFYAHHMLNSQESYYQLRVRNVLYRCLEE